MARHFFHFDVTGPTRERWVQGAELNFECYWVRLVPRPALVAGQGQWFESVHDHLIDSVAAG